MRLRAEAFKVRGNSRQRGMQPPGTLNKVAVRDEVPLREDDIGVWMLHTGITL